jgi:bacteriorhodopsin
MHFAIAITLAFFAFVSALGALRDVGRARKDPRPARFLGVATACIMTLWCAYATVWVLRFGT